MNRSSRYTTAKNASVRQLPRPIDQALLVPEVLALLPVLAIHQILGRPIWTALAGVGLVLVLFMRLALLYGAREQLQRGAYRRATHLLHLALWLYPRSADAQSLLATAELAQGHAEAAEQALRRAIAYMPGRATTHATLSGVLIEQERLEEARQEALQALACDPSHPVALLHLAGAERCLEAPADQIRPLVERGLSHAQNGADEAALRCVLADLLSEEGDNTQALQELRTVEALLPACSVPQQATLLCHLGSQLRQLGQPERALQHFRSAETLDPQGRYAQFAWRAARSV